jgi:hypothetical protein
LVVLSPRAGALPFCLLLAACPPAPEGADAGAPAIADAGADDGGAEGGVDGGTPDAGDRADAGDGGMALDAGERLDGGDGGALDAGGPADAGDAGASDAGGGQIDSGPVDGGPVDAGPGPLSFTPLDLESAFYAEGVALGDIDDDGAVDLVAGPYWYAGPSFAARYEYFAPMVYSKETTSNLFHAWTVDVDDDGWLDVLTVGYPGRAALWYENPGAGWDTHWTVHTAHPGVDNESPLFVDVTGDGARELVFHSGGQLGWATPNADGAWPFTAVTGDLGYGRFNHGLGVGDVDADGDADLLLKSGWWEQPDDGGTPWAQHAYTFGSGGAQMEVFDVDDDGDNDVVSTLAGHGWGVAWFENPGTSDDFTRHLLTDDTGATDGPYGVRFSQPHALAVADLDGDGVDDIVTGKRHYAHGSAMDPEPNAPAVLYAFLTRRGDAGVTFEPVLIDDDTGVGTQVGVGDIDGDGDVDVFVCNKLGTMVFFNDRL